MPAFFGKPGFETRGVPGQEGFGYYSDIENFGDTRDPVPLGIIGLMANLAEKFRKPKDMSEFNRLRLVDGKLIDDPTNNMIVPDSVKNRSMVIDNPFDKPFSTFLPNWDRDWETLTYL